MTQAAPSDECSFCRFILVTVNCKSDTVLIKWAAQFSVADCYFAGRLILTYFYSRYTQCKAHTADKVFAKGSVCQISTTAFCLTNTLTPNHQIPQLIKR